MLEELPAGTPQDVDAWLADIETSTSVDQYDVLKLVARRVKTEMAEGCRAPPLSQPLIWLVHGRPGVGKTDGVLKPIKALFERCGYKQGVDFEFAALQNLNAASFGGSTLHQALGLETGGAKRRKGQASLAALAKRVSRWRWLVIDEISMVSAKTARPDRHQTS